MRKATTLAAGMVLAVALSAGAAFGSQATIEGTNKGEVLRGTPKADTVYARGGADLVYGFRGGDFLSGGNEAGWGDKLLGGDGTDRLVGQDGHDALYGEGGDDRLYGDRGDDLVSGGSGTDFLDGGPGADEIDARDGQKDTIDIRLGEGDVVYYDKNLDVLRVPVEGVGPVEGSDGVELNAQAPPEGIFETSGGVLVRHGGERVFVDEKDVERHLDHGDVVIDATGRATGAEGGRG
jgi:Ca2+-binding RTX toxin-like protein